MYDNVSAYSVYIYIYMYIYIYIYIYIYEDRKENIPVMG